MTSNNATSKKSFASTLISHAVTAIMITLLIISALTTDIPYLAPACWALAGFQIVAFVILAAAKSADS